MRYLQQYESTTRTSPSPSLPWRQSSDWRSPHTELFHRHYGRRISVRALRLGPSDDVTMSNRSSFLFASSLLRFFSSSRLLFSSLLFSSLLFSALLCSSL